MLMAILRRSRKIKHAKRRPQAVTGDFELHYEDVINRNRYALVAVFATGLVLLAVFVPSAVYESMADPDQISVEAENGLIINAQHVEKIKDDITASGNSFVEFKVNHR